MITLLQLELKDLRLFYTLIPSHCSKSQKNFDLFIDPSCFTSFRFNSIKFESLICSFTATGFWFCMAAASCQLVWSSIHLKNESKMPWTNSNTLPQA